MDQVAVALASHPGDLAEWVAAIATIGAVIVAAVQLGAIRATDRANLLYQLNNDFFKPEARSIVRFLNDEQVEFVDTDEGVGFRVNGEVVFDVYELDDYILGPLETIAAFEDQRAVDIDMVYEIFDWYVMLVWRNAAVQAYIEWQRSQPESADVYAGVESLYLKCCRISQREQ